LTPDGVITITHTYAVPAIEWPHRGSVEQRFPWLTREFGAGRMVVLPRIPDDLPPDAVAERNYFIGIGMTSGIGIPIFVAGELICVLTFGYFRGAREWPADLVSRLHLAGNAFANAIERRRAKQRLEQKQQELAHVSRVAAMGELASVIAHELDQPLTAIVSNAEAVGCLLKSKPPDLREAGEAIQDVIGAAMRASEIVRRERRLLRKSRLEFQLLDLNDAVREIELFIRGEARQAGAQITLELAAELPPIMGDRIQLQQVILNMARNAVQAMRDQPVETREFRIHTAAGDAEVTLSVTDAGPPTDQMALEQMFEPFYTTKPNGLGMGLAISRSILDGHHGRIWATRNPGRGIMVNIAIPRK
jgi:C4-dicarboxylate-specific signal transduction histidine kinase